MREKFKPQSNRSKMNGLVALESGEPLTLLKSSLHVNIDGFVSSVLAHLTYYNQFKYAVDAEFIYRDDTRASDTNYVSGEGSCVTEFYVKIGERNFSLRTEDTTEILPQCPVMQLATEQRQQKQKQNQQQQQQQRATKVLADANSLFQVDIGRVEAHEEIILEINVVGKLENIGEALRFKTTSLFTPLLETTTITTTTTNMKKCNTNDNSDSNIISQSKTMSTAQKTLQTATGNSKYSGSGVGNNPFSTPRDDLDNTTATNSAGSVTLNNSATVMTSTTAASQCYQYYAWPSLTCGDYVRASSDYVRESHDVRASGHDARVNHDARASNEVRARDVITNGDVTAKPCAFHARQPYVFEIVIRACMPCLLAGCFSPSHAIQVNADANATNAETVLISLAENYNYLKEIEILFYPSQPLDSYVTIELGQCGLRLKEPDFLSDSVIGVSFMPELPRSAVYGEYVFMVDRSGSMNGSHICNAREGLVLFMKSLPSTVLFNVVSFGSYSRTLFPASRQYNQENLEKACSYANTIRADMGGSELLKPLQTVMEQPLATGRTRNIFLLTDGDIANSQIILDYLRGCCSKTRVFTFGIGPKIFYNVVSSIANVGRGKAYFAEPRTNIQTKIVQCLKETLHPVLCNIKVDWELPESLRMRYSSQDIPFAAHGQRLNVYASVTLPWKLRHNRRESESGAPGSGVKEFWFDEDFDSCQLGDNLFLDDFEDEEGDFLGDWYSVGEIRSQCSDYESHGAAGEYGGSGCDDEDETWPSKRKRSGDKESMVYSHVDEYGWLQDGAYGDTDSSDSTDEQRSGASDRVVTGYGDTESRRNDGVSEFEGSPEIWGTSVEIGNGDGSDEQRSGASDRVVTGYGDTESRSNDGVSEFEGSPEIWGISVEIGNGDGSDEQSSGDIRNHTEQTAIIENTLHFSTVASTNNDIHIEQATSNTDTQSTKGAIDIISGKATHATNAITSLIARHSDDDQKIIPEDHHSQVDQPTITSRVDNTGDPAHDHNKTTNPTTCGNPTNPTNPTSTDIANIPSETSPISGSLDNCSITATTTITTDMTNNNMTPETITSDNQDNFTITSDNQDNRTTTSDNQDNLTITSGSQDVTITSGSQDNRTITSGSENNFTTTSDNQDNLTITSGSQDVTITYGSQDNRTITSDSQDNRTTTSCSEDNFTITSTTATISADDNKHHHTSNQDNNNNGNSNGHSSNDSNTANGNTVEIVNGKVYFHRKASHGSRRHTKRLSPECVKLAKLKKTSAPENSQQSKHMKLASQENSKHGKELKGIAPENATPKHRKDLKRVALENSQRGKEHDRQVIMEQGKQATTAEKKKELSFYEAFRQNYLMPLWRNPFSKYSQPSLTDLYEEPESDLTKSTLTRDEKHGKEVDENGGRSYGVYDKTMSSNAEAFSSSSSHSNSNSGGRSKSSPKRSYPECDHMTNSFSSCEWGSVNLTGFLGPELYRTRVPFCLKTTSSTADCMDLHRTAARVFIRNLEASLGNGVENDDVIVREIVELSRMSNMPSRFTSRVIVDEGGELVSVAHDCECVLREHQPFPPVGAHRTSEKARPEDQPPAILVSCPSVDEFTPLLRSQYQALTEHSSDEDSGTKYYRLERVAPEGCDQVTSESGDDRGKIGRKMVESRHQSLKTVQRRRLVSARLTLLTKKMKNAQKLNVFAGPPFIRLILLQSCEGFWELSFAFARIIGLPLVQLELAAPFADCTMIPLGDQEDELGIEGYYDALSLWATAIALVYMQKKWRSYEKEWELVARKARQWLQAQKLPQGFSYNDVMLAAKQAMGLLEQKYRTRAKSEPVGLIS